MDKAEARQKVASLVEHWRSLSPAQIRQDYQEANTRKDFILQLFNYLGWNTALADEVYEERKAASGAVDYAFRIRGVSRFYLEAKALREELPLHPEWVKQAVSYAYARGIPWVILTNFKELWAFSGDVQPRQFLTLSAERYLEDFDILWLLSREAVEAGLLEQEAARYGAFPPKVSVERRLYDQLSQWRGKLFTQLHLYRKDLPWAVVDETVQRLFNRLIFIRTCEDRKLEEPVLLPLLRQGQGRSRRKSLWENLKQIFQEFDGFYDSELFAFHVLDQQAFFQDDTLSEVIRGLYYAPGGLVNYDFSLIDADVLGRVYEQYLGHVAQVVQQRYREYQLRLERGFSPDEAMEEAIDVIERPQRRKSQGIYYTPGWVVDYIVRQTVGRFIAEHKSNSDAIHSFRILDPACGSGSFLTRAYDELLQHHAGTQPPEHIFSEDRLAILRNNIYGVDLDSQAVEIARLSLLLQAVRERQRLPVLADNIKGGNSLISGGEAELKPFFGTSWREKHAFNWAEQFLRVMDEGGFDVVIGNPPYVETSLIAEEERNYYRNQYDSAHGLFDLYVLFVERGIKLLRPGGRLGVITSGKFLRTQYGEKVCEFIRRVGTVEAVVDLSAQKAVFGKEAITYPVILILRKGASNSTFTFVAPPQEPDIETTEALDSIIATHSRNVGQEALVQGVWPPPDKTEKSLTEKLESKAKRLGEIAEIYHGLQTNADPVFIPKLKRKRDDDLVTIYSEARCREYELEQGLLHALLKGSVHMRRYRQTETNLLLLFPYYPSSATLLPVEVMEQEYPCAWEYLKENRELLESRESGRWRGHPNWYGYTRRNNHDKFGTGKPRILTPSLASRASFSYDASGSFYFVGSGGGGGGGYGIELKDGIELSILYLLGLLNSSTLDYYLRRISSPFRGGYWAYNRQYITKLPIRQIDSANPTDQQLRDAIVAKVEEMLELQAQLTPVRPSPSSLRDDLLREVERLDQQIDQLVFELYGLTEEERRLVAGE